MFIFGGVLDYLGVLLTAQWLRTSASNFGGAGVVLLFLLYLFWIQPALGIKRSHDTGSSAWVYFIPLVGLLMLIDRGNEGDNKYGPDHGPWVRWRASRFDKNARGPK